MTVSDVPVSHCALRAVTASLTLVIINWNARHHLETCLRAVAPLGYGVVVVDNASTDGSAEMVASTFPTVTLLRSDANLGFAGGVNAGVAATGSRWVLVLNPDVLVSNDAIGHLLASAEDDPRVGAAGACLVDHAGQPQADFIVRRFPTLGTLAVDLLLIDKVWPDNPVTRRYLARDLSLDRSQDVDQPAAACLLVRRQAFDEVDGFDTAFRPAWFEDVDFCRRLQRAGWRIRYVAEARVPHIGGVAMRTLGLGSFNQTWYRNMRRYVDRHMDPVRAVGFRALLVVGMALRATVSVLRGRPEDARAYLAVVPLAFGAVSRARDA